jgi:hypothetical protein
LHNLQSGRVAKIGCMSERALSERNSGGAFETWAAKSGHPVEHPDANFGLSLLISEGARL